jgi:hypothetical protein
LKVLEVLPFIVRGAKPKQELLFLRPLLDNIVPSNNNFGNKTPSIKPFALDSEIKTLNPSELRGPFLRYGLRRTTKSTRY